MTLPFDGAITKFFREEAPTDVRVAIETAGKKDTLSDDYPYDKELDSSDYNEMYGKLQIEMVRMQRWVKDGSFAQFSREKQADLLQRLRRLFQRMLRYQTASRLRKTLGAAAMLLGLGAMPGVQAQVNFAPPQSNPFGLTGSEDIRFETLADLDGDGDQDLLLADGPFILP